MVAWSQGGWVMTPVSSKSWAQTSKFIWCLGPCSAILSELPFLMSLSLAYLQQLGLHHLTESLMMAAVQQRKSWFLVLGIQTWHMSRALHRLDAWDSIAVIRCGWGLLLLHTEQPCQLYQHRISGSCRNRRPAVPCCQPPLLQKRTLSPRERLHLFCEVTQQSSGRTLARMQVSWLQLSRSPCCFRIPDSLDIHRHKGHFLHLNKWSPQLQHFALDQKDHVTSSSWRLPFIVLLFADKREHSSYLPNRNLTGRRCMILRRTGGCKWHRNSGTGH